MQLRIVVSRITVEICHTLSAKGFQGRFPFNKHSGLNFRKFHMPNETEVSGYTDPTQAPAYCSCKQDTKERYGGQQNFAKWKGTFRSHRPKRPVRSRWPPSKLVPIITGGSKPKWSVPFDVSTEISEFRVEWKVPQIFIIKDQRQRAVAKELGTRGKLKKYRVLMKCHATPH